MNDDRQRGWGWAGLFVVMGSVSIFDYFYRGGVALQPLVSGLGFLALVPQAFLRPIQFTKPLKLQLTEASQVPPAVKLLGIVGVLLLLAGTLMLWQ